MLIVPVVVLAVGCSLSFLQPVPIPIDRRVTITRVLSFIRVLFPILGSKELFNDSHHALPLVIIIKTLTLTGFITLVG